MIITSQDVKTTRIWKHDAGTHWKTKRILCRIRLPGVMLGCFLEGTFPWVKEKTLVRFPYVNEITRQEDKHSERKTQK